MPERVILERPERPPEEVQFPEVHIPAHQVSVPVDPLVHRGRQILQVHYREEVFQDRYLAQVRHPVRRRLRHLLRRVRWAIQRMNI